MVVYTVKARFKNREGREIGRREELWKGEAANGRDALIQAHEPLRGILDTDPRIDTIGIDIASAAGERISTTEYADEITDGTAARGLLSDVQMPSAQEIKEEARRQDAHALDLVKRQMQEKLCSGKFDNTAGEARPEDAKDSIKGFFDAMGPADKTRHTYPVKDAGEVPAAGTFPVRPGPRGGYNHPGSLPGQPLRDPQDPAPVEVTGDPFRSGSGESGPGRDDAQGLAGSGSVVSGTGRRGQGRRQLDIHSGGGAPGRNVHTPASIHEQVHAGGQDQSVLDRIREGSRQLREAYGEPPQAIFISDKMFKRIVKEIPPDMSTFPSKNYSPTPGSVGKIEGLDIFVIDEKDPRYRPGHIPDIQFQRPRNRKS